MRVTAYSHFKDISNDIRDDLKKYMPEAQSGEIIKAINVIIGVEAVAFVIKEFFPNEMQIKSFSNILMSKDFGIFKKFSSEEMKMIQTIHTLFPLFGNKTLVEKYILEYEKIPLKNKHVLIERDNSSSVKNADFSWTKFQKGDRTKKYREHLLKNIKHKENKVSYPTTNIVCIEDSADRERFEIDISRYIEEREDFTSNSFEWEDKMPLELSIDELVAAAKDMDKDEIRLGIEEHKRKNWEKRMASILFMETKDYDLRKTEKISIEGVQNWIGKLSVGKSTVMDVLSYWLANNEKMSVHVLNSVSDVFQKVDYFNRLGILAVPILSYKPQSRRKHIEDYISSLDRNDANVYGNKTFEYINNICVLSLVSKHQSKGSAQLCSVDSCRQIKEVFVKPHGSDEEEKVQAFKDLEKGKKIISKEGKTCPYIVKCPYYRAFQDMGKAKVIVTTANSLAKVTIPDPFLNVKMTCLEYLVKKADLFLVDEADRVQDTLDNAFVDETVLHDQGVGWISRVFGKFDKRVKRDPRILNDNLVSKWWDDINTCHLLVNRMLSFIIDVNNAEMTKRLEGKTITGFGLWHSISKDIAKYFIEAEEEHKIAVETLMEQYKTFRGTFNKRRYRNSEYGELHEIAGNITDPEKQLNDIRNFIEKIIKNLNKEFKIRADSMKIKKAVAKFEKRVYWAMTVALFEIKLFLVFQNMEAIKAIEPQIFKDITAPRKLSREYDGVVPKPPVYLQFGFRYNTKDERPTIKFIKYDGVGRYVLNRLSYLYEKLDDKRGAHCILLSGTSFAPGSAKYHIDIPVSYILKSKNEKKSKIEYEFMDQFSEKISGVPQEKIKQPYNVFVENLCKKDELFKNSKSKLEKMFDSIEERRKMLFVTGSYEEAKHVSGQLQLRCREQNKNFSFPCLQKIADEGAYPKQKFHAFGQEEKHNGLVAPLKAVDRGHNVLIEALDNDAFDSEGNEKIAAFGGAVILKRPYYIPDDYSVFVNNTNYCYMKETNKSSQQFQTLQGEADNLKQAIYEEAQNFKLISYGYRGLEGDIKKRLLVDTFIDTFQLEGRLIRGGVDAKVYYGDSSLAPNTKNGIENDTLKTSMLLGWKYLWRDIRENPFDKDQELQKKILEELYSIRFEGFENINIAE